MLKWVVAGLVLLNVALVLWATGHKGLSGSGATARQTINPEAMVLVAEIASSRSAAEASRAASLCFRVGPFVTTEQMDQAGDTLRGLSVPFETRTVPAREIRAYRVFLGPFSSASAVEVQRQLLRTSGVTDHYVKRENEGKSVISLGLFSRKAGAEEVVRFMQAKNIQAKMRSEDQRLATTYWLELRNSRANQAVVAELKQARWAAERAKLRQYPCV
jgi:hypothetical protein